MAQITEIRLIDDLDEGREADTTVAFALDGRQYEIDLADDNASRLRDALAPFVGAARRAGGGTAARGRPRASVGQSGGTSAASRERNQEVREWARQHGYEVSERGRIPRTVLSAYDQEQGSRTSEYV